MIDTELMEHYQTNSELAAWSNLHVPVLDTEKWFVRGKQEGLAQLERIRRELDAATAALISTMPDNRDTATNVARICEISNNEARKRTKVAIVCRALPGCLALLGSGGISFEHALALSAVVDKPGAAELLHDACSQTPEQFRDTVGYFRLAGESGEQLDKRQRAQRSLRFTTRPDGMLGINGVLPPVEGMTFKGALEAIMDAKWRAEHPERARKLGGHGGDTHEQRMCDALLSLVNQSRTNPSEVPLTSESADVDAESAESAESAENALTEPDVAQPERGTLGPTVPATTVNTNKPAVIILFNVDAWQAKLVGHGPIPVTPNLFDLARADLYYAFKSQTGEILKFGRARKDPTAVQRLAIIARDNQCIYPGCTTEADRCDIHHINEWLRDQGFTDVEVLGLLCRPHHRHLHVSELKIVRQPNGAVHIVERKTGLLVAVAVPR